jgi:hypothetical protein
LVLDATKPSAVVSAMSTTNCLQDCLLDFLQFPQMFSSAQRSPVAPAQQHNIPL